MKSIFRFLVLGAAATTFAVAGANSAYAQDVCADVDAQKAVYERFTANYSGTTLEQRKAAVTAAKEYLEKYGNCADSAQQNDYFKKYLPAAEEYIRKTEGAAADAAKTKAMYDRFNNSLAAKNWDELYPAGKEVLANEKDPKTQLDVTILLGSIGLDEAVKGNDKYNADTVKYALEAIQRIESGATSENYGVANKGVGIQYKNAKFSDGKNNALGWLNYTVGYIKYSREKNKKDALPYLFKATQYNSAPKGFPEVYALIGQWYLDEIGRLETDRDAKVKAANNVDTDETKAIYALQKGYAQRASDAFARGYKLIGTTPAEKSQKDTYYARTKLAYEIHNGKADGMDAYIASVASKPMPNPTTEVTPVVEAAPTTAPATDTSSATATPVSNPAKPAAATPTKAVTKPATPAANNKTAATTKPAAAKKTNPKK